jgi:outer membrane protein OmpA-like peptidoglycan-associated protein
MRQVLLVSLAFCFLTGLAFAQSANPPTPSDQQSVNPRYAPPSSAQTQDVEQNLKPVYFAFDRYDLTPEDQQTLAGDANWLKANPEVYVTIAGDADDRGGIVYNVVLSQQRAAATRDALLGLGVPADRIVFATGWGKLYPVCDQSDESCWSQNRRAHFEPWDVGSLAAKNAAPTAAPSAPGAISASLTRNVVSAPASR